MNLLLDTNAFLWIISNDPLLSAVAKASFVDPANDVYLSTASLWEMAIKIGLGKLHIAGTPPGQEGAFLVSQAQFHRITLLPIEPDEALLVRQLPMPNKPDGSPHKDPFDRLIIATAIRFSMAVVTSDAMFNAYAITRIW